MKAGRISIDLTAGMAQFAADIDAANAKLRDFGATIAQVKSAMRDSSSASDASGASVRDSTLAFSGSQKAIGDAQRSTLLLTSAQHAGVDQTKAGTQATAANTQELRKQSPAIQGVTRDLNAANESAKRVGSEGATGVTKLAHGLKTLAEAGVSFAALHLGIDALSGSLAAQAGVLATHATATAVWTDKLAYTYRALRLLLSPTIATGVTLAVGIAVEEAAKLTYREGTNLERQSTVAGLNPTQITPEQVGGLSFAGGQKNESALLGLYNASQGADLRDLAERLTAIKDPADRAREALRLFGSDAAQALKLLDQRFVDNSDRVKDWGLAYSGETRDHILEFKHDIDSLREPFESLDAAVHASLEQAKGELAGFFAWTYNAFKTGIPATVELIGLATKNAGARAGLNLPAPGDSALSSGTRGLFDVLGASFRGSGHPSDGSLFASNGTPFLGTADQQFAREQGRLFKGNSALSTRLGQTTRDATQNLVPKEAIDLSPLNKSGDQVEMLREKISRLREEYGKFSREYFQTGGGGNLEFKQPAKEGGQALSNVDKANAVTSLTSIQRNISDSEAQLKVLEHAGAADKVAEKDPYAEKIHELDAQLKGLKGTLAAVGQSTDAETLAKSWAKALETIAHLQDEMARHKKTMGLDQQVDIVARFDDAAALQSEIEWKSKIDETNTSIEARIASLKLETAAIGKGAEAQRNAAIQSQLFQALGKDKDKLSDSAWLTQKDPTTGQTRQAQVDTLRTGIGAEVDQTKAKATQENLFSLTNQIQLEKSLAQVQEQGAEAVRLVTLAYRLRNLTMQGATQEQIRAEIELANAAKQNQNSTSLDRINDEIDDTRRLSAARLQGAEAYRQAQLEIKYEDLEKSGASPEVIRRTKTLDTVTHQGEIADDALKTALAYQNQLESVTQEIASLQKMKLLQGDRLAIEISLKSLEEERTHILSEQALAVGSAKDGIAAFFREMATDSESAAKITHDAFRTAFEGINDELAKLMTGQKTSWGKFLQDLGSQITKAGLQGLEGQIAGAIRSRAGAAGTPGAAGASGGGAFSKVGSTIEKVFGLGGAGKRDGNTSGTAFFVTLTNAQGQPIGQIQRTGLNQGAGGNGAILSGKNPLIIGDNWGSPASPKSAGTVESVTSRLLTGGGSSSDGQAVPSLVRDVLGNAMPSPPAFMPKGESGANIPGATPKNPLYITPTGANGIPAWDVGGQSGAPNQPQEIPLGLGQIAQPNGPAEQQQPAWMKTLANGANYKFPGVWGQIINAGLTIGAGVAGGLHGGGGSSQTYSSSMGMARFEAGGKPPVGKVSLVGEKGPELFVPDRPGVIIPNGKFGGFRAMGGSVDPGSTYVVGEAGREAFAYSSPGSGASTQITNGGATNIYNIDNRGGDSAALEAKTKAGIRAAHQDAIVTSNQVMMERSKRVPQR